MNFQVKIIAQLICPIGKAQTQALTLLLLDIQFSFHPIGFFFKQCEADPKSLHVLYFQFWNFLKRLH